MTNEAYGRTVEFEWGGDTYCAREINTTFNGEPVNITDGCSDGWQELLDEDGETSVQIELAGIYKVPTLRTAKLTRDVQKPGTLTWTSEGATITGTWSLGAYAEGAPYNDAITYTATFMSSGPVEAGTVSS
jgi:predicted secreted protein